MPAKPILSSDGMTIKITKVVNCLCPDGKRRVAVLGRADTWFSINARVKVRNKTVTGFVTGRETQTSERDYEFIPYLYRKNHAVFQNQAQNVRNLQ